jgi:hypothetical protein
MSLTIKFMITVAAIAILFDIYIMIKKGKSASISAYVIRGAKDYPLVAYAFWFLMGHLFWSMPTESVYQDVKCEKVSEQGDLLLPDENK